MLFLATCLCITDDIIGAHVASIDTCDIPLSANHNLDGAGTPFTKVSKGHLAANTTSRCIHIKKAGHFSRVARLNMYLQQ
ncbi:hypothetical protein HanPSC8_Chr17g0765751 [Helianthus annuus]|nr:hypothetical protein HanPSC8_Chr17g0765751 [Helianthus annuus]